MKAATRAALLALALAAPGCGREFEGGGELRARKKLLHQRMQGDPLLEGMPTKPVRVGVPTELAIALGELAITERMIWLGADVGVAMPAPARPTP
jgi:hypothetical protein